MVKRTPAVTVGCLVVLLTSGVVTSAAAQGGADEVERVIKDFLVPFSNRNISEFIEYFADDATAFFPSIAGPAGFPTRRVEGRAAIAREFEAAYQRVGPAAGGRGTIIQPTDLKVQRFNDFAVVTFHLGTEAMRGRRTFVLRQVDARWKIVHLHAS